MPEFDPRALPFLTRPMLSFESGSTFELIVSVQGFATDPLYLRGATRAGPFSFAVPPTADGSVNVYHYSLTDIPLWITLMDSELFYQTGGCYATIQLAVNGDPLHTLVSGYVGYTGAITWPATSIQQPLPTPGVQQTASSANPAAGAELSLSVPNFQVWRIRAVNFQLVAAAVAVSRVVHVLFTDSNGVVAECISATAQTTGQTKNYRVHPITVGGATTGGSTILIPMPTDVLIMGPGTITTVTDALDAGDNFGVMNVLYDQYITQ